MVTKSRLKMAIAAEKGTDFQKVKQKKRQKAAVKRKAAEPHEGDTFDEEAIDDDQHVHEKGDLSRVSGADGQTSFVNLDGIDDSETSDSSLDMEQKMPRKSKQLLNQLTTESKTIANEKEVEDEQDDDDIPFSDLEHLDEEDKEDLVPHSRLTINNTSALLASLNRVVLATDRSVPFATHQTITSSSETANSLPDVSDDLERELAFYSQSLEAVRQARTKLRAEGVPFSRPKDYFAEMVKEDSHMAKVKAKLVEEASSKKAAQEARKLRDLKKFGKQVQVAKLQERQKAKRETLEKIKTLKRKRQEAGGEMATNETDLFDIGIDNELGKVNNGRSGAGHGQIGSDKSRLNAKRQKKDAKYGFGGRKRHLKSGDAISSADLSGFNAKQMKAKGKVTKPSRPGKSRRKALASR